MEKKVTYCKINLKPIETSMGQLVNYHDYLTKSFPVIVDKLTHKLMAV